MAKELKGRFTRASNRKNSVVSGQGDIMADQQDKQEHLLQGSHDNSDILEKMESLFTSLKTELKNDISSFKQSVDRRLDSLESDMSKTIQEAVDTAVKGELSKMKNHMDSEVARLERRIDSINIQTVDLSCNFVIKGLPERENESIVDEVHHLVKDGLGIDDMELEGADRKPSFMENTPGVVVVKCMCGRWRCSWREKRFSLSSGNL